MAAEELRPTKIDKVLSQSFRCPISGLMMSDPVIAADGHSYERKDMEQWINTKGKGALSPMTGTPLAHLELTPNITLRTVIGHFKDTQPRVRELELTEKTLSVAIQLREEELLERLAKKESELSAVLKAKTVLEEQLIPLWQENEKLGQKVGLLQSDNENLRNQLKRMGISERSVPLRDNVLSEHLFEIRSLSESVEVLNEAYSANLIKRFLMSRIARKKLNQTRLVSQEEKILHDLDVLREDFQERIAEIQVELQDSLEELESDFKLNLEEIGQELAQHVGAEGDDTIAEQLILERKQARKEHAEKKAEIIACHEEVERREEAEQATKLKEQEMHLKQIKTRKKNKRRKLICWSEYTRNYTEVLERQRQQLSEAGLNRSLRVEALTQYTSLAMPKVSTLMRLRREQEERSRRCFEEKIYLALLTPNERVNHRAKNSSAKMKKEEVTELLNYTVRGQLDEVQLCLNRNQVLAHAQGEVTDLAGRHFYCITGFQRAVWDGDEEMWELYLRYLSPEEAYDQLMGLLHQREDIIKNFGAPLHFFDLLLNSYEHNQKNPTAKNWNTGVGVAQLTMPAWFIYLFWEPGLDKTWPQKNMNRSFTRQITHLALWFEEIKEVKGKCGDKFAWVRGTNQAASGAPWFFRSAALPSRPLIAESPAMDYKNCVQLKSLCTEKLKALTERLALAVKGISASASVLGNRK